MGLGATGETVCGHRRARHIRSDSDSVSRRPRRARSDAGSMSLEVVLVVPVLMLLALFVLWAGRGGRAALITDLAAEEAATAAALSCENEDDACQDLVGDVLSARPGLDFLCIGGARPDGRKLVKMEPILFAPAMNPDNPPEAKGVDLFGVRFLCETDGAVAPMRGLFPTVSFRGQATEVAIQQGPPRATFSGDSKPEGQDLVFVLSLDAPIAADATIVYRFDPISDYTSGGADCTASAPPDYKQPASASDSVFMRAGEHEATIPIVTCDDLLHEADERFELTLTVPTEDPSDLTSPPMFVIDDHTAVGTIKDDDPAPTLTVDDGSQPENTVSRLVFGVFLNGRCSDPTYTTQSACTGASEAWTSAAAMIGRDITVAYHTETGTGAAPANPGPEGTLCPDLPENNTVPFDYIAIDTPRFLSFMPGALTFAAVGVVVCDDLVGEPDETLELVAKLGPQIAIGTGIIEDNEPRLVVGDADGCESAVLSRCGNIPGLGALEVMFTVERVDGSGVHPEVTVHYVTLPNPNNPPLGVDAVHGGATGVTDPCSTPPGQLLDNVRQSPDYFDYVPVSGSVTIPAGSARATQPITVTLYDDALDEYDETFMLRLCRWSDIVHVDDPGARGTIIDDDPMPAVTVRDAMATDEPLTEDPKDATKLSFTAALSTPSGRDVNLYYNADRDDCYVSRGESVPPDVGALTASPGVDFDAGPCDPPQRVTFPAESSGSIAIEVPVLHDLLDEGPDDADNAETLALRLAADYATLDPCVSSTPPCQRPRVPPPPGVCVAEDDPVSGSTTDDCALGRIVDNDGPPAASIFGPVDSSGNPVEVCESDDPDDPNDPDDCGDGGQIVFDVYLVDPDNPGVHPRVDPDTVRPSGVEVTVKYRVVASNTALVFELGLTASMDDLVPLGRADPWVGEETFVPGEYHKTVTVTLVDDNLDEIDPEDFELRPAEDTELVNAEKGVGGIGLIADDDDPPELRVMDECFEDPNDAPEDRWPRKVAQDGQACAHEALGPMEFVVGLFDPDNPGMLIGSGREVSVLWQTMISGLAPADEQATADTDYVTVDPNTDYPASRLVIPAGQKTGTFGVHINDDDVDEKNELFRVEVVEDTGDPNDPDDNGNPGVVQFGARFGGQGVIVDDDEVELSFDDRCANGLVEGVDQDVVNVDACADESQNGQDGIVTFWVKVEPQTSQEVTVDYYTVDLDSWGDRAAAAGRDYIEQAENPPEQRQTLVIPGDAEFGTIEVPVRDDDAYEHDEVFQLRLADPTNASLADDSALGAIIDDEDPPRLSVADAIGGEGSPVVFTATLVHPVSGDRAEIERRVTADWRTADGTAEAGVGGDYLAGTGTIVFDPSALIVAARTEQTVSVVTIAGDALAEPAETFELRVGAVTPGEIVPDAGAVPCVAEPDPGGTAYDDCAVGTIVDESEPLVRVFDAVATEGGQLRFIVRLVDADDPNQVLASTEPVTVDFTTAPATGTALANARPEGEGPPDDPCEVQVPQFDEVYSYDFDYIALSGTVTFDPEDTDIRARTEQRVRVTTCDDHHDEPDTETLTLELTAATGAQLAPGTAATGWIRDNDDRPAATIIDTTPDDPGNHAAALEGTPVEFTVRLVNQDDRTKPAPSAHSIEIPYHTNSTGTGALNATPGTSQDDGEADYLEVPDGKALFGSGETQQHVAIETYLDSRVEVFERFQLVIDPPADADRDVFVGIGAIVDNCIDIDDYQDGDPVPAIRVDDVTAGESDGEAEIVITLTACLSDDVDVSLRQHTNPEQTATEPDDFTFTDTVVTIPARELTPAVAPTATIEPDLIDEFDEWFEVAADWASAVPDDYQAGDVVATVTIVDDDDPPVVAVFARGPVTAGEILEFDVRLVGRDDEEGDAVQSREDVSVNLYTCCGDAEAGTDYDTIPQDAPRTYEFPADQVTEHTVTIQTHERNLTTSLQIELLDRDKHFEVRLDTPDNADLGDNRTARGDILRPCVYGSLRERPQIRLVADPDYGAALENAPWFGLAMTRVNGFQSVLETAGQLRFEFRIEPQLCPGIDFSFNYIWPEHIFDTWEEYGTAHDNADYRQVGYWSGGAVRGNLSGTADEDGNPVDSQGRPPALVVPVLNDSYDETLVEWFGLEVEWAESMSWYWRETKRRTMIGAIIDDDPLVVGVADADSAEGAPVAFDVHSTPSQRVVSVSYETVQRLSGDNIARSGLSCTVDSRTDYEGADDSLSFRTLAPNVSLQYQYGDSYRGGRVHEDTRVQTCADGTPEDDETFLLRIALEGPEPSEPWGGYVDEVYIEDREAVGTIVECIDASEPPSTEFPPTLITEDVTVAEGEAVVVPFTLSPSPFCDQKQLRFTTDHNTDEFVAEYGSDFDGGVGGSPEGWLVWREPTLENSIHYQTRQDEELEPEESFRVRLHFCGFGTSPNCGNSNSQRRFHSGYADLPAAVSTVTIRDEGCFNAETNPNDPVSLTTSEGVWYEDAGEVEVVWRLSLPLCEDASVAYDTADITAERSVDFWAPHLAGVSVPAGETEIRVSIDLIDDDATEGVESFVQRMRWHGGVPDAWQHSSVTSLPLWSNEEHYIIDDDCLSLEPASLDIDDRVVRRVLESRGAEHAAWGRQAFVAEGETAQARLTLDPPICEQVEVVQQIVHTESQGEDFAQYHNTSPSRPYWEGAAAWTRTLTAGQAESLSDFEIHEDSEEEADERYRVKVGWGDWAGPLCAATSRFCEPAAATVHTIRGSCITEQERDDDDPVTLTIHDVDEVREISFGYLVTLRTDLVYCDPAHVELRAVIGPGDTADSADVNTTVTRILQLGAAQGEVGLTVQNRREAAASIVWDLIAEGNETFTMQARVMWAGAPSDRPWSEATVTIVDEDADPRLVVLDAGSVAEGDTMVFTVYLSSTGLRGRPHPSGKDVSVRYGFGGTANRGVSCDSDGTDYVGPSERLLVFAPGETTKEVELEICDDSVLEPPERVLLRLNGRTVVNARIVDGTGLGLIEGRPTITINDALFFEYTARLTGTDTVPFAVRLDDLAEDVTVDWATEDCAATDPLCPNPATAGLDYDADEGTLTFEFNPLFVGAGTRWISPGIADDLEAEDRDEQFFVRLSNPSGDVGLAGGSHPSEPVGMANIHDFDLGACVRFENISDTVEEGQTITVYLVLDREVSNNVEVDWETVQGSGGTSALEGVDYVAGSDTVRFAPGQTRASFSVVTLADTHDEGREFFRVRLSNPVGADVCTHLLVGTDIVYGYSSGVGIDDVRVPNTEGTGLPTITGYLWVGATLTAHTGEMADEDGMDNAVFRYRWLRSDGEDHVEIPGARGRRYELVDADEGLHIRVRASYTDDRDHPEARTSEPVGPIEPPPPPLTARFVDVPANHDGTNFTFELRFSEEFPLSLGPIAKRAFSVQRGTLVRADRIGSGSQRWEIEIDPDENFTVTVSLPVTSSCGASGAICTPDGRPLSIGDTATVAGPPLTAWFHDVPDKHPGSSASGDPLFSFEVRFSEEPVLDSYFHEVRRDVISVQGGRLRFSSKQFIVTGQTYIGGILVPEGYWTNNWKLYIDPDSDEAVTVTLPAATDCAGALAVCTSDGRPLSNTSTVTIAGPDPDDEEEGEEGFTASFVGVPSEHDGTTPLTFTLRFDKETDESAEIVLAEGTVLSDAFTVTGATLTAARVGTGDGLWQIEVTPQTAGIIRILLPPTDDCTAAGAVCSSDDRKLSNLSDATVRVPLTARFVNMPEARGWRSDDTEDPNIAFEVEFSDDLGAIIELADGFLYGTFKRKFVVNEAQREGAHNVWGRRVEGSKRRYKIVMQVPNNTGDTTITLPAETDCNTHTYSIELEHKIRHNTEIEYGLCTPDGRKLSNTVTATVAAPVAPLLTSNFKGVPPHHFWNSGAVTLLAISFTPPIHIDAATLQSALVVNGVENLEVTKKFIWGGSPADEYTVRGIPKARTVTITLPATTDCDDPGAICSDGLMLSNTRTATITEALKSSFVGVPAHHHGEGQSFDFQLQFSEELELDAATVQGALELTGATATAERVNSASAKNWTITVTPTATKVTITLPRTRNCSAPHAICTADGRKLITQRTATLALRLTVEITNMPESHTGRPDVVAVETGIVFNMTFTDQIVWEKLTIWTDAFTVTGGELTYALEGSNSRYWQLTVIPAGDGDVTITLPATTDCKATGAICTSDGRKLSNSYSTTVEGGDLLTAAFVDMPDYHRGAEFTFKLQFSDNVDAGPSDIADDALTVTGATVTAARDDDDSNQNWTITVTPDAADEDVIISLPATTDCDADGAICTSDGRKLSAPTSATVDGRSQLTAQFVGMPASHDGTSFQFELQFSEDIADIGSGYLLFVIKAVNGTVGTTIGASPRWTVGVRPDAADEDVIISLPATTACTHLTSFCTADGGMLSNSLSATVLFGHLTAEFTVPDNHDGSEFTIQLAFSETILLTDTVQAFFNDRLIVEGATVTVTRTNDDDNQYFTITVTPASTSTPISIELSATTDCTTDGAMCTAEGKPLTNNPTKTIPGSGG